MSAAQRNNRWTHPSIFDAKTHNSCRGLVAKGRYRSSFQHLKPTYIWRSHPQTLQLQKKLMLRFFTYQWWWCWWWCCRWLRLMWHQTFTWLGMFILRCFARMWHKVWMWHKVYIYINVDVDPPSTDWLLVIGVEFWKILPRIFMDQWVVTWKKNQRKVIYFFPAHNVGPYRLGTPFWLFGFLGPRMEPCILHVFQWMMVEHKAMNIWHFALQHLICWTAWGWWVTFGERFRGCYNSILGFIVGR